MKDQAQASQYHDRLAAEPCHPMSSSLTPDKIRSGTRGLVQVRNQGSTPEPCDLTWRDQADDLAFTPQRVKLTVAGGEESTVQFIARLRHRRWIGGEKQHPFAVQIAPGAGEPQVQAGQLVSYGLIPTWLPPIAAALALVLCGVLYLFHL